MFLNDIISTGVILGSFLYFNFQYVIPKVTDMIVEYFSREEKEVIILRGVPGSGKDNYIYHNQQKKNIKYFININSDKHFYDTHNNYVFNRQDINKHKETCLSEYITSLKVGIPTIYINETNEQKWMYENMISLAKLFNYKVSIVEMVCSNREALSYFNVRSSHNVPMKHSIRLYESFEYDDRSNYVNNNPAEYKKFLDRDIDNFMNNYDSSVTESGCSDSDSDSDSSWSGSDSQSDETTTSNGDDYFQLFISKVHNHTVCQLKNYEINILFLKNKIKLYVNSIHKPISRYVKI